MEAEEIGVENPDFSEHADVASRLRETVSRGLDVTLDCGTFVPFAFAFAGSTTSNRHVPRTQIFASQCVEDIDVPDQRRSCPSIKAAGVAPSPPTRFTPLAITSTLALFKVGNGARFIGNGQAPVHRYQKETRDTLIILAGKFERTL